MLILIDHFPNSVKINDAVAIVFAPTIAKIIRGMAILQEFLPNALILPVT